MEPEVLTSFHASTGTWQYIIADPKTHEAVIIDSVLDFDPSTRKISTETADELLGLIETHKLTITRILETHAHADHLTASRYLQQKLGAKQAGPQPKICIGHRIVQVQAFFGERYGIDPAELRDVFDHLWADNEEFSIGELAASVMYLPGHTPDHVGYRIGSNVFTGDSIFNPDVGSARADFPGGSATDLFRSMSELLALPGHYKLYTGHDYPPLERAEGKRAYTTVQEQNEANKHVKKGTTEREFVDWRASRDGTLGEPRLLHQAMQFNIRAGRLPRATAMGDRVVHVPLNLGVDLVKVMDGSARL